MPHYDAVVVGAGLGGLTTAAILARAGRKVLVLERSNSVGGAASSYKVGDLFVEGSLHETSNPTTSNDRKHDALVRAGVLDDVAWSPSRIFYEVRGGPLSAPLIMPDHFAGAREILIRRFPDARAGIEHILQDMQNYAASREALSSLGNSSTTDEQPLSLQQKLDSVLGDNEALKCAIAANLSYYHDDPATLDWRFFASLQGSFLQNGACFIHGGSQRLSSALARAIRMAGGHVVLRRNVQTISPRTDGGIFVTHTAKDGNDAQTIEAAHVVSNAAPETTAAMLPDDSAAHLRHHYAGRHPSISLFALTLGLSKLPREFGVTSYSTQLLPPWMTHLSQYAQGGALLADEPGDHMPPLAIVDYAAIDSGLPAPPYVLSVVGPDRLSNWDGLDLDAYRAKRARWQTAIVTYLNGHYPGLAASVTATSFNTALSVRQYLGTPHGAAYGFAPTLASAPNSPRTVIEGLYLSSAYANFGGYTGVIEGAAICADMILRQNRSANRA
jgi:phytoene dehydrogenase-like protein